MERSLAGRGIRASRKLPKRVRRVPEPEVGSLAEWRGELLESSLGAKASYGLELKLG
jgi:hypothetical protein